MKFMTAILCICLAVTPLTGYAAAGMQTPDTALVADKTAEKLTLDPVLIEDELLELINSARQEDGTDMLEADETMLWAARLRAGELFEDFSHTRPNSTNYNTIFDDVGFSCAGKWHGENITTVTFTDDQLNEKQIADFMYDSLTESPGHINNMLREQYGIIGVGVSIKLEGDKTTVTSSQLFASK